MNNRVGGHWSRTVAAAVVLGGALMLFTAAARGQGGDASRGEKRFEECASCHSVAAGENGVGPSLHGIINRKAASLEDFRYSPAMRNSGLTWTPETIDTFIADPQKLVPANRMAYAGLTEGADRADLIAYLQQATK